MQIVINKQFIETITSESFELGQFTPIIMDNSTLLPSLIYAVKWFGNFSNYSQHAAIYHIAKYETNMKSYDSSDPPCLWACLNIIL